MITVTLPKSEYDKTQDDIKKLKETIAEILEQKESFILKGNIWHPFGNLSTDFYVRNFTTEEKEVLLTKKITDLKLELENIRDNRNEFCKKNQELDRLANSRLEMIKSLQETITQLQTKQKDLDLLTDKKVIPSKPNMIKENGGSIDKPWWKLF